MTLKELALRIGTTPQTVQRLETANMTVSTDWLERIAQALDVRPIDLLEGGGAQEISYLGQVDTGGRLISGRADEFYSLDIAARDPVAVSLTCKLGPYDDGETLIGSRYFDQDMQQAVNRDCIVSAKEMAIVIGRIIAAEKPGGLTVVPFEKTAPAIHSVQLEWVAPIIMSVRFFH